MKECWSEGTLRAYIDRELAPQEMTQIAAHRELCATCSQTIEVLAARAQRVSASLSDLAYAPALLAMRRPAILSWRWAVAGATLAAAAGLAALTLLPDRPAHHRAVQSPVAHAPGAAVNTLQPLVPAVVRTAAHHRRKARPVQPKYFMAFDNEPIDTGVVMRVAFESGLEADVIVDAEGHARAIRPVSFEK